MDARHLEGRVALVTGGALRVGRAICEALANAGAHVIVHYRSSGDAAERTADALRARGVHAWTVSADLADPAAAESLLARARDVAERPVDVLVNNASAFPERALADASYADLDAMMRVHAWAPLALARAVHAQADADDASVVNVLDTRVTDTDPAHYPYLVSKQALAALTRSLALELAPRVRVNGVAPGAVLAPVGEDDAYLERFADDVPLKRTGRPEDVADAVAFLASARFTTGQVIFVDGGRHVS